MAKRFTDTEKWKKPFIRGLEAPYKLLWFYICDDCDHAGIWQVDIEVAELRIGEKISEKAARSFFEEKIVLIDDGKKWFIPSFIEFQYPSGLNPANKAHGGIIKILQKYNLLNNEFKPLTSPLQGSMDMDKEMVKEMDKDKRGTGGKVDHSVLTGIEANQAFEFLYRIGRKDLTNEDILNYWEAFKIHKEDYHKENRGRQMQHFRDWLKFQKKENVKNGAHQQFNSTGTTSKQSAQAAAANRIVQRAKQEFERNGI